MKTSNEMYQEFLTEANYIASSMAREFDAHRQAWAYKNRTRKRSGDLDLNRIAQYKTADDLFKRMHISPKEASHGLYVLLDWSGSIAKDLVSMVKQTIILAKFARKIKIDFTVYSFHSYLNLDDKGDDYEGIIRDEKNIDLGSTRIMEHMTADMGTVEFEKACRFMFYVARVVTYRGWDISDEPYGFADKSGLIKKKFELGGTPLCSSLITMMTYLRKRTTEKGIQNKNLLVVTDGASEPANFGFKTKKIAYDPITGKPFEITQLDKNYVVYKYQGSAELCNMMTWIKSIGFETTCIHIDRKNKTPYSCTKMFVHDITGHKKHHTTFDDITQRVQSTIKPMQFDGVFYAEGLVNYDNYYFVDSDKLYGGYKEQDMKFVPNATAAKISTTYIKEMSTRGMKKLFGTIIAKNIAKKLKVA